MKINANSPEDKIKQIPEDRKGAFIQLRNTILDKFQKGMKNHELWQDRVCYVVPLKIYPSGYHCDPTLPLPFINIASQKNFIAFYHSGLYSQPELYAWFVWEFPKYSSKKPDMGKSCVRFKKTSDIPFRLIGKLVQKMSVSDWIQLYEEKVKPK
ncbi:DUF1801 domain-containing protein [Echinicola jeungdonensis]|uniref:DUF1801 domain-containing protein n=1 Tax=Echinicola jeungdonensis TaxID=709343 RepID=A0ABV5J419_9BACT|nr:DUF1801 domain-containing protein [Echinicola jeungdonensis]MDN3670606.1 DUF1801 domain-containing protein [Echinicola jeungdonensis]